MRQSSRTILRERRAGLMSGEAIRPWNGWKGWLLLVLGVGAVLAGLRTALGSWWAVAGMLSGFLILSHWAIRRETARFRALAGARAGESLCTFVRSFPGSRRDPLLIRVVYETIQQDYLTGPVPLRASDRFEEDLGIDDEDVDELAGQAAALAGRRLNDLEANPWYGKVRTPGDLVAFLQCQPESLPVSRSSA